MRVHEQTDQSLRPRPGVLQRRANSHGQGQAAHLGPERILALQRAAGNRAVSDLLQGVVQRCGPVPCACPDQQGLQQADVVQRAVNLQPGATLHNKQIATNTLNGDFSLGYTPPTLNNAEIGGDAQGEGRAKQAIVAPGIRGKPSGSWFGGYDARVSSVPTNTVSFAMYLPVAPPWTAPATKDYVAGLLSPDANHCGGQAGNTAFSVHGVPDDARLAGEVDTHEHRHVSDHVQIAQQVLGRWDAKLQEAFDSGTTLRAATPEAAEEKLFNAMGGRPDQIASRLHHGWGTASDRFHQTADGRTNVHSAGAAPDCSSSFIRFTVP